MTEKENRLSAEGLAQKLLDEFAEQDTTEKLDWEDFKDSLDFPYKLEPKYTEDFALFCAEKIHDARQEWNGKDMTIIQNSPWFKEKIQDAQREGIKQGTELTPLKSFKSQSNEALTIKEEIIKQALGEQFTQFFEELELGFREQINFEPKKDIVLIKNYYLKIKSKFLGTAKK